MNAATSYPMLLGQVVRFYRRQAGLQQDALAAAVGVTQGGWSRVETGASVMTLVQLRQAARTLNVSPHVLIRRADDLAAFVEGRGVSVLDEIPQGGWLIRGTSLTTLVLPLLSAMEEPPAGQQDVP